MRKIICTILSLCIALTAFNMIIGCRNDENKIIVQDHEIYVTWAKEYAPDILKTLFRAPSCGELTCFPTVPTEKNKYPGIPSSLVVLNFCTGAFLKAPNSIPPVDSRLAMDEFRAYYKSGNSVIAVELSSGNVAWKHDFSIEWPIGGYKAPVLYKDWVIYSTMVGWPKGTSGCIVAMNKQTGETAWRYQTDDPMSLLLHIQDDTLCFFQVKFDSSIDDYSSKMVALDLQTQELKCETTIPGSVEKSHYYPTQNGVLVETFKEKFTAGNVYLLSSQTCEYKTMISPSQEIMGSLLKYADDSVYVYRDEEMSVFDISSGDLLWKYHEPQEVAGEKPLICRIDSSILGFFYDHHIVTVKQDTGEILKTVQINDFNSGSVATSGKTLSALQDVYLTLNEEEVVYSLNNLQLQQSPQKPIKESVYDVLPMQWKHEIELDKEQIPYKVLSGINTEYDSKIYLIENYSTIKVFDLYSGDLLQSETMPDVIHSKLIVDDTSIYYKNDNKSICALDRTTLKPKWTHTLSEDEWTGHLWEDMKLFGNKLFAVTYTRDSKYKQEENLGSVYGNLIVLNKNTGEEEWKYILPENAGVIDSDLFIWNNLLFFTHYDGESSIHNSSRTGSYGGTVYKVDMNTYAVTSILCPGMIFNGSLLNTQSSLYGCHHSGNIFQIDPLKEKVTKVFNSNVGEGLDWKLLQYVDDAILIRGPGPLQCYELPTLQPKWTCVLPNQLHIVSNIIEWDENHILVADEASNFHLINKQTGEIEKSFSIPMSLITGQVGFTPRLIPSEQTITKFNNLLLVKTKSNEQIFLTALDISKFAWLK
ncbi:MAG: PQQ-binding-like beta-propeller repeat protein [Caldisericia bacterium]|nr:PQQ-binding-like beta-propeller repeat protein [Caldisericia bacterium]